MPHTCCDIFWWCTYSRRSQRSCKPGWRRMISARAKPMRERKNTHLRTKAYLKLNIRCLYWASVNRFCDDSRKSTSWVKFWALAQSADTALWHSCNRCCPSLSAHKVAPSINEHSSYVHITKENKQLKGNTWVTFIRLHRDQMSTLLFKSFHKFYIGLRSVFNLILSVWGFYYSCNNNNSRSKK